MSLIDRLKAHKNWHHQDTDRSDANRGNPGHSQQLALCRLWADERPVDVVHGDRRDSRNQCVYGRHQGGSQRCQDEAEHARPAEQL